MIGEWFRHEGIDRITVSSVGMAQYFKSDGWKDITIAFPVNVRQIEDIKTLSQSVHLGLVVLDPHTIDVLGSAIPHPLSIWLKLDVGTHRTGILPENHQQIEGILRRIKHYPHVRFAGFMAHAGHTYRSRSVNEVQRIYDHTLGQLIDTKKRYADDFPGLHISIGDTPGASVVSSFGPIDELRPGNFVFYDLMQEEIGACTMDDIAVAMACPVVAVHPERLQWIIYGGAIHFSKDGLDLGDGRKCFGRMVDLNGPTWSVEHVETNPYIISLSQEHGVVQCTEERFHRCKPGDLSWWLPVHSCLTADAMGEYVTLDGDPVDHYRKHKL